MSALDSPPSADAAPLASLTRLTNSLQPPSGATEAWLRGLEHADAWVDASTFEGHAAFLFDLVEVMRDIGVFPAHCDLLVTWTRFDLPDGPSVQRKEFPATRRSLHMNGAPPVSLWISPYTLYHGHVDLGLGMVVGDEARLDWDEPMTARSAMDAIATMAHKWSSPPIARFAAPDGVTLRRAIARHLVAHPEWANRLAEQHPLTHAGFVAPPLTPQAQAAMLRSHRRQRKPNSQASVDDYRVPIEVMKALGQKETARALLRARAAEVARRLGIGASALRAALNDSGRLTLHGRQCLRPDLIRAGAAQEIRDGSKARSSRVGAVQALFDSGQDIAAALADRRVSVKAVKATKWSTDPVWVTEAIAAKAARPMKEVEKAEKAEEAAVVEDMEEVKVEPDARDPG
ncbi:hypothetical protein [Roseateles sp. MS654]|uniref:hypothetical protein n=1 Tax=Roseateles sp. MS654 TaxID=3412685 RepID=UPI003C2D80DB